MKDFKNKIIEGIKKGEIRAESRWRFLAHDYFFWGLTGLSGILGSLAVASILHKMMVEQIAPLRGVRLAEQAPVFIKTLPFIWICLFVLLILVAWFNYKKISKSYRRHNGLVIAGVVIGSLLLGGLLFGAGVGKKIDQKMRDHVPVFQKEHTRREGLRKDFLDKRGQERGPGFEKRKLERSFAPQQ